MVDMTMLEPTDAALDREIEQLVGMRVRGELDAAGVLRLEHLISRRAKGMRPSHYRGVPTPPRSFW